MSSATWRLPFSSVLLSGAAAATRAAVGGAAAAGGGAAAASAAAAAAAAAARAVLVYGSNFDVVDTVSGKVVASTLASKCSPSAAGQHVIAGAHGTQAILSATVNGDGSLLATTSDDKAIKVWDCATWTLKAEGTAAKRVSTLTFAHTGTDLLAADKFGDVWSYTFGGPHQAVGGAAGASVPATPTPALPTATPTAAAATSAPVGLTASLLMGHLSIVTDLVVGSDNDLLITSDRDEKIRVSRYPKAFVVEGFCLGHFQFVTCVHIPAHQQGKQRLLLSGGGDGLLILWDYDKCVALQTVDLARLYGKKTGAVAGGSSEAEEGEAAAAANLDVMRIVSHGNVVVVAAEYQPALYVFHLTANNTLEFVGVHATDGNPVDLSFDAAGRLWLSTDQTTERLLSCLKLKTTAAASYKSLDAEAAPEQLFEFDADTQANLDSGVNVNGSIAVAGKPAFKYQYGELRKISIMRPGSGDSAAGAAGNDEDDDEYTTKAVGLDAPEETQAEAAAKRSRNRRERFLAQKRVRKTAAADGQE